MKIEFAKYQGTGNDFVMIDNLDGRYNSLTVEQVRFLCDRRFGIGSDGLIRINSNAEFDFEMDFFNPDGSKSFCGNGARCSVAFAETLGLDVADCRFVAIDGEHRAIKRNQDVSLQMKNVDHVDFFDHDLFIHTGSPHYMHFVEQSELDEIVPFGKRIRYSDPFVKEGVNVNLVHCVSPAEIAVRTYERGVEDETFSCGTGVTAAALATSIKQEMFGRMNFGIQVKGGHLDVAFKRVSEFQFEDVWLTGPAEYVFKGSIDV